MRRGFTLIELLVVVSIIVLLIALLAPALANSRVYARMLACETQQRTFMQATVEYAADNNRWLPFTNSNTYESSGQWNGPGWLYEAPNKTLPIHREAGALWPYVRNHEAYRCPADDVKPGQGVGPTHNITSYAFNTQLRDDVHLPSFHIDNVPSDFIVMWESDTIQFTGGFWNDGNNHPNEFITRRHGEGAAVGLVGGSTQYFTREDWEIMAGTFDARLYMP